MEGLKVHSTVEELDRPEIEKKNCTTRVRVGVGKNTVVIGE